MPEPTGRARDDVDVPVEFVAPPAQGRVYASERRVHLGDVDASARALSLLRSIGEVTTPCAVRGSRTRANAAMRGAIWRRKREPLKTP